MSDTLYQSVGGKLIAPTVKGLYSGATPEPYWDFGWIPPEARTREQHEAHDAAVGRMPAFAIRGRSADDVKKVNLTELWKHPDVIAALGYAYSGTHQLTGSCFRPGTLVRLADGTDKPIETFEGGEEVVTHRSRARKVVRPTSRPYSGNMVTARLIGPDGARPVTATADHRFLSPSGDWVPIGRLAGGAEVIHEGRSRDLDYPHIRHTDGETVHCLEVEEDHSFRAEGFTVHNCVGAGGGNVAATVSYVDAIRLGDSEKCILPFYPYTYGRSRYRCGMNGQGEGSLGSAWAEAAKEDGILDNLSEDGLPKPNNSDGLVWGASVEMKWSAGNQAPCTQWLDKGVKHPIRTISRARNAQDVKQGLINLYPSTCASMYGFNAEVRKGVLFAVKGPRWSHQMSIQAFWEHPDLGPIYWIQNQWGLRAHGTCPSGMPGGGAWAPEKDIDWICRDEVFVFSQYEGYPTPDFVIPWVFETPAPTRKSRRKSA